MKARLFPVSAFLVSITLLALSLSLFFHPVLAGPPEYTPTPTLASQWGISYLTPKGETSTEWQTAPAGAREVWVCADQVAYENEVLRLINVERVSQGLWPLRKNSILTSIARAHNLDMINNHFTGHTGSDGRLPDQRAEDAGYGTYGWGDCYVGENIAYGYTTPAEAVAGWMASPGHRANILEPTYREIGVAYNEGGAWDRYWTTPFGSQPNVLPVFINNDEPSTSSPNVTLTLSNETVSGWDGIDYADQVMISNYSNFAGATWEGYSQTKNWTLTSGAGSRTVYVMFQDTGGTTVTSSDDIQLTGGGVFTDVSASDWFYDAVMNLYNRGVVSGYPDGTFRPSNQVTRAEFATMLVRAMAWAINTSGSPHFSDVSPGAWYHDFVETAYNQGMVSGYPDGTFRPDNPISRAEIATMIVRARGWAIDTSGPDFPDVPSTHWAYGFIKTARNHGVVGGYPDGTFKPDNPSTRAEAAAMIYRALP